VIPILTSGASAATSRDTNIAHAVTLGVVGGMLFLLTIWTAKGASKRGGGGCFYKWGPTIMVGLSMFLVNANNVRQVLQDQNMWGTNTEGKRGWAGAGWFATSTAYICADQGHCCPSTDPAYGGTPQNVVYDKTCTNTTGPLCPHLDIPWSFACDAGRGIDHVNEWLEMECKENEGPLLLNAHWGCTAKPAGLQSGNKTSFTNREALVALTNHTYVYGNFEHDGPSKFQAPPNATACANAKVPMESCGFLSSLERGCHVNMNLACLNSTGFTIIILCVYSGFLLMMVGSLWNAKICTKINKAQDQWNQLRGGNAKAAPTSSYAGVPTTEAAKECET